MSRLTYVAASIVIGGLLLSACASSAPDQSLNDTTNEPESISTDEPSLDPIDKPGITEESETVGNDYSNLEIITLLPQDAIPAIDNPQFLTADEADEEYAPDELILGVEFNGESRAYSINLLSSHEIVNDNVGDVKISVTW